MSGRVSVGVTDRILVCTPAGDLRAWQYFHFSPMPRLIKIHFVTHCGL